MDEELIATPPGAGVGTETPPQAAPPGSQEPAEPQPPGPGAVEPGEQTPQDTDAARRKPSDFYRERNRIRKIEDSIQSLAQQQAELLSVLRESKTPAESGNGQFDPEKFFADPNAILTQREKRLLGEIQKVRQELDGKLQSITQGESDRKRQEALEMLFPRDEAAPNETLEARVNKDPERTERVLEILKEPGMIQLFEANPNRAIKFILGEAGELKARNPKVIDKRLMGGIAKGSPAIGGKKPMTEEEIRSELAKMREDSEKNLSLRDDPQWKTRRSQLMSDLKRFAFKE